jgi:hypothetical protein
VAVPVTRHRGLAAETPLGDQGLILLEIRHLLATEHRYDDERDEPRPACGAA